MNRGGGKFFRPQGPDNTNNLDSDSSDESDASDEMPPPPASAPSKKTKINANLSSSESDDSSDDDAPISTKRSRTSADIAPKSKKPKPSFFDEEAEASDGDDEEEEEYGTHHDPHDRVKKAYTQEDIRRENMDDEALAIINRQNRRRNHLAKFSQEDDVEDVARQIEERHRMASRRVDRTVLTMRVFTREIRIYQL